VSASVTIVDYGIGNLYSVTRAFEASGAQVRVTADHRHIADAERVVVPGVGAFADGMKGLRGRNQIDPVKEFIASGRPFLGICVGMQLLHEVGEEFGEHEGLGIIPGRVVAIEATGVTGEPHRVPHIGWNALLEPAAGAWDGSILAGLPAQPAVYFLHSFAAVPSEARHRLADCQYNGRTICAAVRSGQVYGCQFHPEKSGPLGLKIIENFLAI
jgi:imidazole glycerol-phosphate synthase subunit HisH